MDHGRGSGVERAADGHRRGAVGVHRAGILLATVVDIEPAGCVRARLQGHRDGRVAARRSENDVLVAGPGEGVAGRGQVAARLDRCEVDVSGEATGVAQRVAGRFQGVVRRVSRRLVGWWLVILPSVVARYEARLATVTS